MSDCTIARGSHLISRRNVLAGLLPLSALILSGCNSAPRTIRYRLTLDVETPEGARSGSGVIQITMHYNDGLLKGIGNEGNPVFSGEAVVVDLKERGLLFCLLSGDPQRAGSPPDPSYFVSPWFHDPDKYPGNPYDYLNRQKPVADVPLDRLPMLVRFRDIADPKTVERVDPNNLAARFGDGVTLLQARIEITDDPVTTGIEKRLGWLTDLKGGYLSGEFTSKNAPLGLYGRNFKAMDIIK